MGRFHVEAAIELRRAARPLHFKELCQRVLARLDPPYLASKPEEDIREKMAMARQHGSFYCSPLYLVGLVEWFSATQPVQSPLFSNLDMNLIAKKGSAELSFRIALRAKTLRDILITKKISGAARDAGFARGITVEEYVKAWFQQEFPKFYKNGPNRRSKTDFLLNDISFDVASAKKGGIVGIPADKIPTRFHVFGEIIGDDVFIQGYLPGEDLPHGDFPIAKSKSIVPLLAWFYCRHDNIDWELLKLYALHGQPSKHVGEILCANQSFVSGSQSLSNSLRKHKKPDKQAQSGYSWKN